MYLSMTNQVCDNHHVVTVLMGMIVEEDEVAVVKVVLPVVEVTEVREGVVEVVVEAVVEIAGFTIVKGDVVALGEAAAPPPHKDNGTVAVSASQASG